MVELALATPQYVVNDNGLLQGTFLEQVVGYGEVIMQSHPVQPPDCMIVFSHSGVNAVPVEVALVAERLEVPVIAITSLEHAGSTSYRHPAGLKLADVATLVVDSGAPSGDALVQVRGLDPRVGATSSITSMAILHAISVRVAELLVDSGVIPTVIHSHNRRDEEETRAHQSMEGSVREHGRRLGRRMVAYDPSLVPSVSPSTTAD